ncbi:MAG TPA: Hint domain-containing protein [Candidatus Kapabacteria bacterium]|nr:Hint domain-containing protein [Candidatus Kapabacteria bacterium]
MPSPLTSQDRADIQAMLSQTVPGCPTQLDFSNPLHYRFYTRQLDQAGIVAPDYPEQFNVLTQSVASHIQNGPPPVNRGCCCNPGDVPGLGNDDLGVGPIQIITELGSADGTAFTSSALSSLPDNPFMSQLTLGLYDPDSNPIGPAAYVQQYDNGTDLTVEADGTKAQGENVVVAIATYFWQDQNGNAYHGYLYASTSQAPENITNDAPKPNVNQTVTRLCLGRCDLIDCTYCPAGGDAGHVTMPVAGSITFFSDIDPNPTIPNTCTITMTRPETGLGGGCPVRNTNNFFSDPNTKIEGKKISWDLVVPFQPVDNCLIPNSEAIYTFIISLTVNNLPVYVTITSGPVPPNNPYYLHIPKLEVWFSCLAEGTEITLENGTSRPIEQCQPGDRVLSNLDGDIATVESMLKGTEVVPMIRLVTNLGHNVLVTDGHPMVTPTGVTLARLLQVNDPVLTLDGEAIIVSNMREMFHGYVWNLNAGPRIEDNSMIPDTRTFFAGGLLVGDNRMQFKHNRRHRMIAASVQSALPARWLQDFNTHVNRRKRSTPF